VRQVRYIIFFYAFLTDTVLEESRVLHAALCAFTCLSEIDRVISCRREKYVTRTEYEDLRYKADRLAQIMNPSRLPTDNVPVATENEASRTSQFDPEIYDRSEQAERRVSEWVGNYSLPQWPWMRTTEVRIDA
jgi:hypothetical protein